MSTLYDQGPPDGDYAAYIEARLRQGVVAANAVQAVRTARRPTRTRPASHIETGRAEAVALQPEAGSMAGASTPPTVMADTPVRPTTGRAMIAKPAQTEIASRKRGLDASVLPTSRAPGEVSGADPVQMAVSRLVRTTVLTFMLLVVAAAFPPGVAALMRLGALILIVIGLRRAFAPEAPLRKAFQERLAGARNIFGPR